MSISTLSLTRFPGSISGLLQVASLLSLLLLLFKAAQFLLRRQWLLKALQQFPSPPSHWFFGHKIPKDQELQYILKWVNEFPSAFPHWLWGSKVRVLIYDPEYMKAILGRSGESEPPLSRFSFSLLRSYLGYGLLLLNGETWFQHRRMLTPAFHYDILKPYVGITADSVRVMLVSLSLSFPFIHSRVSSSKADSIMVDIDSSSYFQAIGDLNYLFFSRARNVFHQNDTIYRLTSDGRLFQHACQLAHEHTDQVIGQRKAQLQNEGELEKIRQKRHLDFLDILLCAKMENGSSLSDEDLRAEVDTFMFEGHDTTASAISWIFYALATHPEHQQKCREEVLLKGWLRACPLSTVSWKVLDDCVLQYFLVLIPRLTVFFPYCFMVTLSIYGLHHNPKVWPNPEVFDPSRFAPGSSRHSHSFLPFSGGSRNCIGKQFAMNELKVAVALTLLRFELLPDPTRVPVPMLLPVMKSKNGIHLRLRKLQ
uniref:Uncharacterized protein n=1 Tax=Spermophilus dauricus TaxID=99837 RepID=A0A8C9PL01_SPEDA